MIISETGNKAKAFAQIAFGWFNLFSRLKPVSI